MADNVTTFVYRGELYYAKVLGEPVPNYNKDGKEWTFDFVPNDPKTAQKELKAVGVADRLRTKEDKYGGRPFLTLKQSSTRKDGSPNKPINVVKPDGKTPWPQESLIGNGSVADVKFVVIDNGPKMFKGVYPRAIRVLKHEAYETQAFEPLDDDDEFIEELKASKEEELEEFNRDFGLDDEDDLDDDLPM